MFDEEIKALDAALAKAAQATGLHNKQECHDAIEEHRVLVDSTSFMPDTTKEMIQKQIAKINRKQLDQVMAGYALCERIHTGDLLALKEAAGMAAAVNEVLK